MQSSARAPEVMGAGVGGGVPDRLEMENGDGRLPLPPLPAPAQRWGGGVCARVQSKCNGAETSSDGIAPHKSVLMSHP